MAGAGGPPGWGGTAAESGAPVGRGDAPGLLVPKGSFAESLICASEGGGRCSAAGATRACRRRLSSLTPVAVPRVRAGPAAVSYVLF